MQRVEEGGEAERLLFIVSRGDLLRPVLECLLPPHTPPVTSRSVRERERVYARTSTCMCVSVFVCVYVCVSNQSSASCRTIILVTLRLSRTTSVRLRVSVCVCACTCALRRALYPHLCPPCARDLCVRSCLLQVLSPPSIGPCFVRRLRSSDDV